MFYVNIINYEKKELKVKHKCTQLCKQKHNNNNNNKNPSRHRIVLGHWPKNIDVSKFKPLKLYNSNPISNSVFFSMSITIFFH